MILRTAWAVYRYAPSIRVLASPKRVRLKYRSHAWFRAFHKLPSTSPSGLTAFVFILIFAPFDQAHFANKGSHGQTLEQKCKENDTKSHCLDIAPNWT